MERAEELTAVLPQQSAAANDFAKLAALLESGALTRGFEAAKTQVLHTSVAATTTTTTATMVIGLPVDAALTTTTTTVIGLPMDAALVQRSVDGAAIVHRPFSAEEKSLRSKHNATLPMQNVAFNPPPLQWKLHEDVEVSFDLTIDAPTRVWVMWAHCPHGASDEVQPGTTRVTRSFVVDRAALVKQVIFTVGIGSDEKEYTYMLPEVVYLNDTSSGIDLFREIPQPVTLIGTSFPPGATISQIQNDYFHLSDDRDEIEAYNDLGVRYTYDLNTDAWLKILTDWARVPEQTQFIRRGRGEGCIVLRVPFVARGKISKIGFALEECDAAAFGPSWAVNVDVRKMCDVHQHFWGPRHGDDRGPRPEHYDEPYEAGVVINLEKPVSWDTLDEGPGVYALGPDGLPVQNEDWRRLEAKLRQTPDRTEHDPTPLRECSCCVVM